jgi:hypothetical protein
MIMHAKTVAAKEWRGYQRQGSSEISAPDALYAVDFCRNEEKIRPELLAPAASDRVASAGKKVHEANGKKIT